VRCRVCRIELVPSEKWAHDEFVSTARRRLIDLLTTEPRSASSLATEMGLRRGDIEEHLGHALRTAAVEGHSIEVIPARCKDCGFLFGADRLSKPGRCPSCKGGRLFEPLIRLVQSP
jgi:predicted Zn-ribbon and HTH transcriptional regulator